MVGWCTPCPPSPYVCPLALVDGFRDWVYCILPLSSLDTDSWKHSLHYTVYSIHSKMPGTVLPRLVHRQHFISKVQWLCYDKVSAKTASSVPKTSKFQSGHRVVKMVLNTWYYLYLWQTKWYKYRNHPKHSIFENRWFRFIIWAPDIRNHQK